MPVILGEHNSPEQREYLEMAKRSGSPMVNTVLERLAADGDIQSGREQLNPEWVLIYREAARRGRLSPLIEQFFERAAPNDAVVSDIDPSQLKQPCFLLGAGASKPEPSGIPTVKELLPDLLARARRLDRDEVTRLANFCDSNQIDNIEDLLTAAQISEFCSRNPAVLRLVDFLLYRDRLVTDDPRNRRRSIVDVSSVAFLQSNLQVLFGLLSSRMLPADPNGAHDAVAGYVKNHPKAAVITTNYDCCMDRAFSKQGMKFSYKLDFAKPEEATAGDTDPTPLVKLHGSLNWFYCETCQNVHLIDIERTVTDFQDDRAPYPVIGVCKTCGGQRRGLLVPPLAMKFDIAPPLNPLLDIADAAFNSADLIVVVGFSFAEADVYISRMLSKAMQRSPKTKLLIFDPDLGVLERTRRKFSLRIPDLDASSRILAISGDCAERLPAFLAGKMYKGATTTMKASTEASPVSVQTEVTPGAVQAAAAANSVD